MTYQEKKRQSKSKEQTYHFQTYSDRARQRKGGTSQGMFLPFFWIFFFFLLGDFSSPSSSMGRFMGVMA